VQQHLGRLDGVKKVDVSLLDKKVAIYPEEDARFDPAAILKATYDSGVSVVEMSIEATGRLTREPGKGLVFNISPGQALQVAPGPLAEKLEREEAGKPVKLRGRLYTKPAGKVNRRRPEITPMEILEVLK
jgi:hypothetical protein